MISVEELKRHIEEKIMGADIEMSPFPHLIIENFFPENVYSEILAKNPFKKNIGVKWLEEDESENVKARTPYHARKQINFHQNQLFEADPQEREFWEIVKTTFLEGQWFSRLILRKFPIYFQLRFGDALNHEDFFSWFNKELFLQRHEVGYNIGPHTDIPIRVFTCIFSFSDREGFDDFGTELLEPENIVARCWGNDHYTHDGFRVKKVAPYKPNNFLLFFKTRQSFHAVKTITEDVPNQRYGMQFQFYEPPGGIFEDMSAPHLMHVIRPKRDAETEIS